jgi:LacI family transcriptional regulator
VTRQRRDGGGSAEGRKRPTIRQVADAADVSVATVSRVFAGSAAVSAGLTQRVLDAAGRLGYAPHVVAQSLAGGRNNLVGMLVPNLADPHFYALIKQVLHEAERDSYQVLVADSDESPAAEGNLGTSLLHRSDGLIMCAPRSGPAALRELLDLGKPVLMVDRVVTDPVMSSVVVDAHAGMRDLVRHLVDLGHRHITYLHGPARSWQEQERWRAVRGFRKRGVRVDEINAGATLEDGQRVAAEVLATGCTAVAAHNDLSAIGLVAALAEQGVRVPEDLSVTGYDDIPFGRYTSPPLTTVRVPELEAASATWQTMRGLLDGHRPGARVVLRSEPVLRGSTGSPPEVAAVAR